MIRDAAISTVTRSMLLEVESDYVGLWQIPWELRRECPDASNADISAASVEVLRLIVEDGARLGDFSDDGDFVVWCRPEALEEYIRAWHALGRDPNIR
jgi:hypothetical protein